jgi:hypothetical protein
MFVRPRTSARGVRDHLFRHPRQIHLGDLELEGAGGDARDLEQVVDEPTEPSGLSHDGWEHPAVGILLREELQLELECGERRAQLVRRDRDQRVARVHRCSQLLEQPSALRFGAFPLR